MPILKYFRQLDVEQAGKKRQRLKIPIWCIGACLCWGRLAPQLAFYLWAHKFRVTGHLRRLTFALLPWLLSLHSFISSLHVTPLTLWLEIKVCRQIYERTKSKHRKSQRNIALACSCCSDDDDDNEKGHDDAVSCESRYWNFEKWKVK